MERNVPTATATEPVLDEGASLTASDDELIEEDDLIEDISIDGMCGVY